MARTVEEWIGKTDDTPVPQRVKDRVFIAYGGRCHWTKTKIMPGMAWDVDHVNALCNAPHGENWNRESNLAPILRGKPHKEKTAKDVGTKKKTNRMRAKNNGTWEAPYGFPQHPTHYRGVGGQVKERRK